MTNRLLFPALVLAALLVACGSSSTPPPTSVPRGSGSTPVGVAVASGPGSDTVEGAVANRAAPSPTTSPPALVLPVESPYQLGDVFGSPRLGGRIHAGLDFALGGPLDVKASCAGTVTAAGPTDAYELSVRVDCGGGWSILVGYLGAIHVAAGQRVRLDSTIGAASAASPVIHFEIRWQDVPLDPQQYLDFNEAPPETPAAGVTPVIPGQAPRAVPTARPASIPEATPGATTADTPTNGPNTATATPARPTPTPAPPTPTATPTPKGAKPPAPPPPILH